MSSTVFDAAFAAAISDHDQSLAGAGLEIWLGSEPTFTDRSSLSREWLHAALGGDKEQRARDLTALLAAQAPHAVVLRTVGRQYPDEDLPRWSYGLYADRGQRPLWHGPADPLQTANGGRDADDRTLQDLRTALAEELRRTGWTVVSFDAKDAAQPWRIAARCDQTPLPKELAADHQFARPLTHTQALPVEGLRDALSDQGCYLFVIYGAPSPHKASQQHACVELPGFADVTRFHACLKIVADAALGVGLDHLIMTGFPPPWDPATSWTTVTPDPAVIEVNMAPATSLTAYHTYLQSLFAAARQCRLEAERYYYNGHIVDSGGGGHITVGGPSAQQSPFRLYPDLLPRLVAYFNRHPSLSYYFAVDHIGSASQSPRPDEGLRDTVRELQLAMNLLTREPHIDLDQAWATLAPFLTDYTGNTHRAEINVEKLANPYLAGRGRLGLVEFRALRMAPTPQWGAAMAGLLRSIVAMLSLRTWPLALTDWGDGLHDRFALPFYLAADLDEVLDDLAAHGFPLPQPLAQQVRDDSHRRLADIDFAGYRITVRRAIQFWPLIGDVAGQEGGGSRLVDASTARLELTVRSTAGAALSPQQVVLSVRGYPLPLRDEKDGLGQALVGGVHYRSYVPQVGLHPSLAAQAPAHLEFRTQGARRALRIGIHEWKPDGAAYDGLPPDRDTARTRCRERIVTEEVPIEAIAALREPPPGACSAHFLDLRFCP